MSRAEYLREWRKRKKERERSIRFNLRISNILKSSSSVNLDDLSLSEVEWIKSKLKNCTCEVVLRG